MSVFEYEELKAWEGFDDLNRSTLKLRGSMGNLEESRALYMSVPDHLKDSAKTYFLELSISGLSKKLLEFAKEVGALDLPHIQESLEVAIRIRDAIFSAKRFSDSGHVELLKGMSGQHGEAFAVDSMAAALSNDLAELRCGGDWLNAQDKADFFASNLKRVKEFIDPQWMKSADVGNTGFRIFSVESTNQAPRGDFSEVFNLLAEYQADDLSALVKSITKDDNSKKGIIAERGALVAKQIDSALDESFASLIKSDEPHDLFKAAMARPAKVMEFLGSMSDKELSRFVMSKSLYLYLNTDWIYEDNEAVLEDRQLIESINQFNDRVCSSPYFEPTFQRSSSLNEPWMPGIPFALLSSKLNELNLHVKLYRDNGGTSLETFSDAVSALARHESTGSHAAAGLQIIEKDLKLDLIRVYKKISEHEEFGKRVPEPASAANPNGVSKQYQINFAAVRICAELQQPFQTVATEKKKITPYAHYIGEIKGSLRSKNALMTLVKSFEEEIIVDALAHYKGGFMPFIEQGILSKKHMNKLSLKDRGKILESDMGM